MENPGIRIISTEDGSKSLFSERLHETYHSKHGAVRESMHVFIEAGLLKVTSQKDRINLLEVGFGTGLNALLTLKKIEELNKHLNYCGLEPFPLSAEILPELGYDRLDDRFASLHQSPYSTTIISERFNLTRTTQPVMEFESSDKYDLVYYDAFGPPVQPEMWEPAIFAKLFSMMSAGGILVTYCAKGSVRRAMIGEGFIVERLPGPPGKREMLRATKPMT